MKTLKTLSFVIFLSLITSNVFAFRNISPYAYCAGDPINNIDPTGESTYALTDSGKVVIAEVTNDNFDYLVSSNGNKQRVNDQTILSNLASGNTAMSSSEELVSLYFFVSDNSSAEWGCAGLLDGSFLLGTNCNQSEVSIGCMLDKLGKTMDETWFQMHTHSFEEGATKGGSVHDRASYDQRINDAKDEYGNMTKKLYLPLVYHKASKAVYLYNNSGSIPGRYYGSPRQFSSHSGLQHTYKELYLKQFQLQR